MTTKELKARHKAFAEAFIAAGGNATEAYLIVSPAVTRATASVLGTKLMHNPDVMAILRTQRAEVVEKLGVSKEFVTETLMDIVRRFKYGKPYSAIQALTQLSKMYGYDAPVKSINANVSINGSAGSIDQKVRFEQVMHELGYTKATDRLPAPKAQQTSL
jgi:hypothetical protein